jgi:hypothetical protein
MNAAQVIKQIDALDETEQGKVIDYVRELEGLKSDLSTTDSTIKRRDLSDLIGSMEPDADFDKAVEAFRKVDEEMWK